MAIPLTINGATFEYPQNFDESWGVNATGWAQAVTNGMLQMAGGSFPLTADVNFGPNFGLLSKYFKTRSASPATTGTVRLSSADAGIAFLNNVGNANLVITTDSSDRLLYNGNPIATTLGAVTSLIATANQTTVSSATGAVTIGTVQNINTTSSPTFAGLTLTGLSGAVSASAGVLSAGTLSIANGGTGQISFAAGALSSNGSALTSGTLSVANGGTGDASFNAYSVLTGGTTPTGAIQSVVSVGSAGQVLTSNGAAALPTFQNATGTGTVNSGTANHIAYYATSSATISDSGIVKANVFLADGSVVATANLDLNSHKLVNVTSGSSAQDAVAFTQLTTGAAITTGGVASNTLTGSTANSGGSAGNVAQGTISTPDFRTNAVSNIQSSLGTTGSSVVGGGLANVTITTIGKPVLIFASAGFTGSGGGGNAVIGIQRSGSGTLLPGSIGRIQLAATAEGTVTISTIDTPAAGTYTYTLDSSLTGVTATSNEFSLVVFELRV